MNMFCSPFVSSWKPSGFYKYQLYVDIILLYFYQLNISSLFLDNFLHLDNRVYIPLHVCVQLSLNNVSFPVFLALHVILYYVFLNKMDLVTCTIPQTLFLAYKKTYFDVLLILNFKDIILKNMWYCIKNFKYSFDMLG